MTGVSVVLAVRSNTPALMVTWDSSQSEVAISHYQVQYRVGTTSWMQAPDVTGSPPATTTYLEGLEAGTLYSVQVRAVSSIGNGAWSGTTSGSTYNSEYPGMNEIEVDYAVDLEPASIDKMVDLLVCLTATAHDKLNTSSLSTYF